MEHRIRNILFASMVLSSLMADDDDLPYTNPEETTEYFRQFGSDLNGFYSQYEQDRYISETFFKNKTDGIFVDIGAHNGIAFSNTKFFEDLGWTGICIEPIPEEFSELKKNRKAHCVQGCISNFSGTSEFWRIKGPCETLSGLVSKYDLRHIARIKSEVFFKGGSIQPIEVDCFLFNDILDRYSLTHVDYLSIDTEGGELDILKTIDFSRFDIEIIDVEDNYGECFYEYLVKNCYKLVTTLYGDQIYQKDRTLSAHKSACIEKMVSDPVKRGDPRYQLDRAILTIKGDDADPIPKVPLSGQCFQEGSQAYQLMHNGVKIVKDCYYDAPWLTDVIFALKGHHEPQEEKVFYEVLKTIPENGTMIELGAYWGYYSLWFATAIPGARNFLIEPDAARLQVGRRNFEINGKQAHFYQAYASIKDNDDANYTGASQILIDHFLNEENIEHVDILHADIQGAECDMLITCMESIQQNKIDYFFISTHQPWMHDFCLDFFRGHNCLVLAEHTGKESCSGDGLIVARRENMKGPESIPIRKYPH